MLILSYRCDFFDLNRHAKYVIGQKKGRSVSDRFVSLTTLNASHCLKQKRSSSSESKTNTVVLLAQKRWNFAAYDVLHVVIRMQNQVGTMQAIWPFFVQRYL
jgi:cell division protein ZapA (FtsZ GTPase activity inhibitor)